MVVVLSVRAPCAGGASGAVKYIKYFHLFRTYKPRFARLGGLISIG